MDAFFESLLEQIEKKAAQYDDIGELRLAREAFHHATGEFAEGEPWYELRMTMFQDWYLLDRVGADNLTPVERFIKNEIANLSKTELRQLHYLTSSLRSVFRIKKINGTQMLFDDLVGGGKWIVHWTFPTIGLSAGDILNTRVIFIEGRLTAGRGTVLHPGEAHETIETILSRALSEGMKNREIVDHLDKMRLKLDRYSNVKIRHVYQYPNDAVL